MVGALHRAWLLLFAYLSPRRILQQFRALGTTVEVSYTAVQLNEFEDAPFRLIVHIAYLTYRHIQTRPSPA